MAIKLCLKLVLNIFAVEVSNSEACVSLASTHLLFVKCNFAFILFFVF